jgi:hypothetical protein
MLYSRIRKAEIWLYSFLPLALDWITSLPSFSGRIISGKRTLGFHLGGSWSSHRTGMDVSGKWKFSFSCRIPQPRHHTDHAVPLLGDREDPQLKSLENYYNRTPYHQIIRKKVSTVQKCNIQTEVYIIPVCCSSCLFCVMNKKYVQDRNVFAWTWNQKYWKSRGRVITVNNTTMSI